MEVDELCKSPLSRLIFLNATRMWPPLQSSMPAAFRRPQLLNVDVVEQAFEVPVALGGILATTSPREVEHAVRLGDEQRRGGVFGVIAPTKPKARNEGRSVRSGRPFATELVGAKAALVCQLRATSMTIAAIIARSADTPNTMSSLGDG